MVSEPGTVKARSDASAWARLKPSGRAQMMMVLGWVLGLGIVIAIPLLDLPPIWSAAALLTVIYVPAAVGQNLIIGNAGLLAMGQAAFVGVGAYTSAVLAVRYNLDAAVTIPAAMLLSGFVGALVGFPALRINGDYLFIVSLGFNLIVIDIILQWGDVTGGATGLTGVPTMHLFGIDLGVGAPFYLAVVSFVLLSLVITQAVASSRFGLTMEAIRDDEVAARSIGIATAAPKVYFFAIGSALAGLSGALLGYYLGYVGFRSFDVTASLLIFQMAVIGGLGRISGSIVGACIIILLPELLRPLQDYRLLLAGLLIVTLMATRPQGIFGKTKITNLIKK
ncbi:branched-chain amino acid ABC transporter permease [Mesorhizobium sp. AR10]|uniref:branched-chain amino acid ABC transporter permease n=1 Tax=Mesorhizobium sp. AR10 TaxID=2865839 RepID=UPI00215E49B0|nr:branched-chain amino acid ABC transporter permease [Mesorhizobium sp. AR10]UVK37885.1 branched-chain amino acid ABC transporter permease [Mesorhizobium sp. AR10]